MENVVCLMQQSRPSFMHDGMSGQRQARQHDAATSDACKQAHALRLRHAEQEQANGDQLGPPCRTD
jgi:hypothetical protein